MYTNYRKCVLSFVFCLLLFSSQEVYAIDPEPNSIVATVYKKNILYKNIKADVKVALLGYPEKLTPSQIESLIHKSECESLKFQIRDIIFKKSITDHAITVSEKEIDTRLEEMFQKAGIDDKKSNEMVEMMRVTAKALEIWQEDIGRADEIYNELLKPNVSKESWKAYQVCYDTPEKLKKMKSFIPKNLEDMKKNSRTSTRNDLLYEKLKGHITKKVSVNNGEIEKYYHEKYDSISEKPSLDEVKDEIRNKILLKKNQAAIALWWQNQYKDNVNNIEKRFKSTVNRLMGVPVLEKKK